MFHRYEPRVAMWRRAFRLVVFVFSVGALSAGAAESAVSYNRDIRAVLSDKCIFCHGPDAGKRKGKLRLDIREEAIKSKAFVPGQPEDSELIKRIFSTDPEKMMPPPESSKRLTDAQKELFRRWIAQDAKYEGHWAYQKPVKPTTPSEVNAVDWLVAERLKLIGLKSAPEADRRILARRLYSDLIGVPPTP